DAEAERHHRRVDDGRLEHARVGERLVARRLLVVGRRRAGDRRQLAGVDDPHLRQPVGAAVELPQRGLRRHDAVHPHAAAAGPGGGLLLRGGGHLPRLLLAPPSRRAGSRSPSPLPISSCSFSPPASSTPLPLPLAALSPTSSTTSLRSPGSSRP